MKSFYNHKCGLKYHKVKCPSCSKDISKNNLAKHIGLHSAIRYQCSLCHKKFKNEDLKMKHMQTHAETTCDTCGKSFASATTLKEHSKVHTRPIRQHDETASINICKVCKLQFPSLSAHESKQSIKK